MAFHKIKIQSHGCERGKLIAFENGDNLDFVPQRTYVIYDNLPHVRRGFHAHKKLKQVVCCISGSCKFYLTDGFISDTIELNNQADGIYIEGLVWREMYDFSSDCILIVLASEAYDTSDYIYSYDEFMGMVSK